MTINEVAEILTDCSIFKCYKCKYEGMQNCQNLLIAEMGAEVRKIAEQLKEQKDE